MRNCNSFKIGQVLRLEFIAFGLFCINEWPYVGVDLNHCNLKFFFVTFVNIIYP